MVAFLKGCFPDWSDRGLHLIPCGLGCLCLQFLPALLSQAVFLQVAWESPSSRVSTTQPGRALQTVFSISFHSSYLFTFYCNPLDFKMEMNSFLSSAGIFLRGN